MIWLGTVNMALLRARSAWKMCWCSAAERSYCCHLPGLMQSTWYWTNTTSLSLDYRYMILMDRPSGDWWQAVFLGESILGLVQFTIVVSDVHSGIEYIFCKLVENIKLHGAFAIQYVKDAIQRDTGRLGRWSQEQLIKVNKNHKSGPALGLGSHKPNTDWAENLFKATLRRIWGSWWMKSFSWCGNVCALASQRANHVLDWIKRSMISTLKELILPVYSTWSTAFNSSASSLRRIWACWSGSIGGTWRWSEG